MIEQPTKLRIAWFTPPFTQQEQGKWLVSSYCSRELLPLLMQSLGIDVYTVGAYEDIADTVKLLLKSHAKQPYDGCFFQIEDVDEARPLRMIASLIPGVVLFHDVLFRLGKLASYLTETWACSSNWFPEISQHLRSSVPPAFAFEDCRRAFLPLFSVERNLTEYRRWFQIPNSASLELTRKQGHYIPHPVSKELSTIRGREVKKEIPQIAYCGSPHAEHRVRYLLKAITCLDFPVSLVWLAAEEERGEIECLAREFGLNNVTVKVPRSFDSWKEILASSDIAVHTAFSAYGDPGPWLAMSLMAGTFCIVSDFSASALLPESVVIKTCLGEQEVSALEAGLRIGSNFEGENKGAKIRSAAQAYAGEFHSSLVVSQELQWLFQRNHFQLRSFTKSWLEEKGQEILRIVAQL